MALAGEDGGVRGPRDQLLAELRGAVAEAGSVVSWLSSGSASRPSGADVMLWLASSVYALGLATVRGFEGVLGGGATGTGDDVPLRGVRARVTMADDPAVQHVDYGTLLDLVCGGGVETVDLSGEVGFGDGLCSAVASCVGRGLVGRMVDVSGSSVRLAGLDMLAGSLATNETCGLVCHGLLKSRSQHGSVVAGWQREHGAGVESRVDLGAVSGGVLADPGTEFVSGVWERLRLWHSHLPALIVGVDVGALSWGEPVTIDTAGWPQLPSVLALDDDRVVVAWLRSQADAQDQSHASCASV